MEQVALSAQKHLSANANLLAAIGDWQRAIGANAVVTSSARLSEYALDCSGKGRRALAILQPENKLQLQECLKIANKYLIPYFTISSGKNWGYGSRSPSTEGCVLIELKKLNKILELNVELAYAVIEPGVTQQQLYDYLESNNIPLMLDVTGASPQASIIGNLCERGSGLTPYSDHFQFAAGFEVLLADGSFLKTGFGHFSNARVAHLYRWGIGPYLDGLFTQSNMGIVTSVAIWLMPKPQAQAAMLVQFRDDQHFAAVIEILRDLKLKGILSSAIHIANDLRVLMSISQYPWEEAKGVTPLPDELRSKMQQQWGVAEWNLIGGIWGTKAQVKLAAKETRRALKGLARVMVVSDRMVSWLLKFRRIYEFFGGVGLDRKISILGLLKGVPSYTPLRGAYWRKKLVPDSQSLDPDRDGCGLIWLSVIFPLTSKDFMQFVGIVRNVCATFGFETNINVSLITERAAMAPIAIAFDADNPDESERAARCHKILLQELMHSGYPPYRMGTNTDTYRDVLCKPDDVFWQVSSKFKQAVDPDNLMSPSRYVF